MINHDTDVYLDINECDLGTSGCTQVCNNTIGSYICSCNAGYILGVDNHTCNGKVLANFAMICHDNDFYSMCI